MYVGSLHENVRGNDLVELLGLRPTNYLTDNWFIEIYKLQQNKNYNGHAFTLAACHVCDDIVKLHGLEFDRRKIIIEGAKHHLGL